MFAGEAASKGIELTIECAPELPRSILGDGAKVKQILINLASNALKFTERGSIRFKASAHRERSRDGAMLVKIVVADTGIGIAAQDTARIFQPFEQLDAGKRAGGTGLGLAISLGHARLMGGDLTVESAPGVGSTFTFTFAAKSVGAWRRRPAAGSRSPQVVAGATRVKVLIVDDVAVNRDVLAELLSGPRFETRTAADGTDAISIHADWRPDLVLIDLRMPGMGGLEAIRRLQGRRVQGRDRSAQRQRARRRRAPGPRPRRRLLPRKALRRPRAHGQDRARPRGRARGRAMLERR